MAIGLIAVLLASCTEPAKFGKTAVAKPQPKATSEAALDPDFAAAPCPVAPAYYQGLTAPGTGCVGQPSLRPPGPIGISNLP